MPPKNRFVTCEICGDRSKLLNRKKRKFMAKFPLDESRCREWVKFVGKEDLIYVPIEKLHSLKYVCGAHFQNKAFNKKKNRLKTSAVPSINLGADPLPDEMLLEFPCHISTCTDIPSDKMLQRTHDNENSTSYIKVIAAPSHMKTCVPGQQPTNIEITDNELVSSQKRKHSEESTSKHLHLVEHDYCIQEKEVLQPYPVQNTVTTEQNLEGISLKHSAKDNEQSQERRALNAQALKITLARIQENPQLYIGIPKNCYHIVDLLHKQTKIPTTHILLCLKKVKLDTHFEELADQFGIPSEEAKGIFVGNIPVIAKTLQSFIANPNSKNIKSNLLVPFRRHQNTTTVIDTLELKVQPTTAQSKELTQSENGNTIKYLISCCPDGFVDYVSPGYGGRQTDENLLESTGYLERFDPGTCIITKRFKNAEPMLLRKGMKLLRSRSYTKQFSLRADQYAPDKRILDDHIERVVQRVREFTMIKDNTAISSDLVRVLDEAVVISCALINLQSFVIN